MLKPNDRVMITVNTGDGQETFHNCIVVEFSDGLLKVKQFEKTLIFNMRSTLFHSVEFDKI